MFPLFMHTTNPTIQRSIPMAIHIATTMNTITINIIFKKHPRGLVAYLYQYSTIAHSIPQRIFTFVHIQKYILNIIYPPLSCGY